MTKEVIFIDRSFELRKQKDFFPSSLPSFVFAINFSDFSRKDPSFEISSSHVDFSIVGNQNVGAQMERFTLL